MLFRSGVGAKVALKGLGQFAPKLSGKVDAILATNRTKVARELAEVRGSNLNATDKANKIASLEKSYTLTKKVTDAVKGSSYRNADLAVRMNNDIEEFTNNNEGEGPGGQKVFEMFIFNTIASSMEMKALKFTAGSKVAKGSISTAIASTSGNILKSIGVEGTQETIDGVVQQINQKLGSADYKDKTLEDILSETSAEILAGTLVGTVAGGEVAAISSIKPRAVVGRVKSLSASVGDTKTQATNVVNVVSEDTDEEFGISPEERELNAENLTASLNRLNVGLSNDGVPINESNVGVYVTDIEAARQVFQAMDKKDANYSKHEVLYNKGIDSLEVFVKDNPNVKLSKRTIEQFGIGTKVLGPEVDTTTEVDYDEIGRASCRERVSSPV